MYTLFIFQLMNLTEYSSRITVGLAKPVSHFVPFKRLSYIFNFFFKFDVGMIKQRFLQHHRVYFWKFLLRKIQIGVKGVLFKERIHVCKVL